LSIVNDFFLQERSKERKTSMDFTLFVSPSPDGSQGVLIWHG